MSEFGIFLTSMILSGIFLLFCIGVDLVSYIRKKNIIKPVEFFAPKGYSPIDAALVYSARRVKANALFTPLLLYWADQGFITVEEDGRGLKITKKKWLLPFEESGRTNRKTYDCELTLFSSMFRGKEDEFYTLAATKSVDKAYDETINDCKKLSRSVIGKTGKIISLAMKIGAAVLAFFIGILISFHTEAPIALIMLFPVIGVFLMKFMPEPAIVRVPFMAVWGGVPLLAALFIVPSSTLFRISIGVAILVLVLTVSWFAEKADFRKKEDLQIYGKVCSFKRFLTVADKNRLEALVEEFPDYFYDVLPFFYVFGITKKMRRKFDKIIPDGSMRALGPIRDIYID